MKKIALFIITLFIIPVSFGCPICGCGVGGFYIGLLPTYNGKFVGVRYQYSHYETRLKDDPGQFSHDYYKIAELYGGITLGTKWQLLGFIPYHFNYQNTDDGIKRKNGLGDASIVANYEVWKSTGLNRNNKQVTQQLWLGAGVKLPTGQYNVDFKSAASQDVEELLGDVNSEMGTGSLDFIANAMYNIHFGKLGINTTVNYKINTNNKSDFRYGDRLSANSFVYYQATVKNSVFMAPNIGLLYEHVSANNLNKSKVDETGGYAALASAGVDININKITVGANVQLPVAQDYALGQTQYKTRGLVHVTYTF